MFINMLSCGPLRSSRTHASSFLTFYFSSSLLIFLSYLVSLFYLAGDIAQLKLPVGMQTVDFDTCEGLTGTAGS